MPLLQWTPSNPPAQGLQYQVTVKVRYRGQTPAQAMASNPVRLQATVPTTSYQVPLTEQLGVDATDPNYAGHVWQVQALLNGRQYGRNRGASQIEWFVVPPIAVDPVKPSDGRSIAVVEWEVPYEEIRPGRPIKLQVPPIQEDTVLCMLRVRVPEKLSLQQLEQLRKNWAHEVRKEISAERTHQDTFVVQSYPPKYATIYRVGQDTFGVQYGRYIGGFFLYGLGQDTFGVQYWPPKELVGYYLDGTPQDTAGAGVDRTRYTGGFFLYRMGQDTFGVQKTDYGRYTGGFFLYGMGQDTAGAGVPRTYYGTYGGGFFLYGTPQDTAGAGVPRTYYGTYGGGFFLYGMGQDTVPPITSPPTTAALVPPTYTVWTKQPIGYPVEGGIVLGEFTPTHVGLPIPVPESISANVRRGTQGEIVVTFTQLH